MGQYSIVLSQEMIRLVFILTLLLACIAGYTIPGRKNAGSVARNYRVASYNLVDQEDTLADKDVLKTTETTEMIDENENQVDSTETTEQKENSDDVRDPSKAEEFDEDEFVSSKSEIEYDYGEYEEDEEGSGRSNEEGPLAPILARVNLDSPLGQFLSQINDFKIRIKKEINILGRNIRLGLAFLNVG